ncbi:MAG: hypothetical protein WCI90_08910 [Chlorobium sp.]|nr:MAG: hypothetical protein FDX17_12055 [Chlorobium sp.]
MDPLNPNNLTKAAIGIGGAALVSPALPVALPLAIPLLHGLAGIAVVGLGLFSAGSLVGKAVGVLNSKENPFNRKEE